MTTLLSLEEVAKVLDRHPDTVRKMARRGQIGCVRSGGARGRVQFLPEHVDEWVARHTVPARTEPSAAGEEPVQPVRPVGPMGLSARSAALRRRKAGAR